jgi:Gas vesicle synthesis protein GvpL/GvpF
VIWVYAVTDRPEVAAPRRRGLAQAPLDAVRHGDLAAVITRHGQAPAEPALDALWVHERVVERLMADRTVLPMRFGTTLADADALRASLAARHDDLVGRLRRVRGRVELGVRAVAREPDAAAAAPADGAGHDEAPALTGRAYLMTKLARGRAARDAAAALHGPLAARAVESSRRPCGPGEVLRAAYLVERADVPPFLGVVERLRRDHAGVALLCTGPWPAYSFAGEAAEPSPSPFSESAA